jgi:hypothetical protein
MRISLSQMWQRSGAATRIITTRSAFVNRSLALLEHMCYTFNQNKHRIDRSQSMFSRNIMYSRQTQDFAIFLDGALVGYAHSYLEAEAVLDQLVLELLRAGFGQRVA